ncbi:hypothetical protein [Paracoccus pacificus]|uniref:Uncharacterized protein n=1 Tax=Paracoccus pacificus TaxID=1463598 RepID=A0ABW4R8K2_9RHOB
MLRRIVATTALTTMFFLHGQSVTAASARPLVYFCQLVEQGRSGWVPDFLAVSHTPNGRIVVQDPIIQYYQNAPIEARIVVDNTVRRTYAWSLRGTRDDTGQRATSLDYRLTIQKAGGAASLSVIPRGYDNSMQGRGNCIAQ